ncbi:hypothetical protein KKE26_00760 [bacterium]|nr:hypothetical protein [bacterium]MBU1754246.1 hypothetical protein [bacterium]
MFTEQEKMKLRKKLAEFEGNAPYMYLDSKGNVTVGVGHLISSQKEAQKLDFFTNEGNNRATEKQIKEEYEIVKKLSKSRGLFYYRKYTKLHLKGSSIDTLTNNHIIKFEKKLKEAYPEFDYYPTEVRLALFDMIFNLGSLNKWNTFNSAIKAKDWKKAADDCRRKNIQSERNEYVKELLLTADTNNKIKENSGKTK